MTLPEVPADDLVNAMSAAEFKVYENRLRRAADRQGLRLVKAPRRDPRAVDYGTYQLVDRATEALTAHGAPAGYGLSVTDVHRLLAEGVETPAGPPAPFERDGVLVVCAPERDFDEDIDHGPDGDRPILEWVYDRAASVWMRGPDGRRFRTPPYLWRVSYGDGDAETFGGELHDIDGAVAQARRLVAHHAEMKAELDAEDAPTG